MTPERPIKFAVAGLGRIGERHVRQAVRIDGFELTAVCDTSKEVRKKFAAAVDFEGFKTFDDYRKMLDAGLADVAVIATPSHLHYEMTLAALDAGCNVLVEKPMAADGKQAKEMLAAAEKAGRFLTIHQSVRYQPDTQMIKQVVDSGVLGQVFQVYSAQHNFNERKDWQIWRKFNGGAVSNVGVHHLDAAMLMVEGEPETVFAGFHRILDHGDADDCFKIVVRYNAGQIVEAEILRSYFPKALWHICGTRGSAWIDDTLPEITMHVKTLDDKEWSQDYNFHNDGGNVPLYYDDLADKLLRGEAPPVTPQSVIRQLQVIDAARKSNQTKQSQPVDLS
ncbi:MAG: Gfo/Idh/MocA family oxidoreductase [Phycisphaerae bacterium]|jgi:predicted dehydrogenase|nr:Gfo/Idh/MocA family oxidoreductase [Phycisphaerae bacterium]